MGRKDFYPEPTPISYTTWLQAKEEATMERQLLLAELRERLCIPICTTGGCAGINGPFTGQELTANFVDPKTAMAFLKEHLERHHGLIVPDDLLFTYGRFLSHDIPPTTRLY